MGKGTKNTYTIVLAIILVASLAMLFFENVDAITGHATEGSTVSNVTIQSFLSIQMSDDLTDGIVFEDVLTLPTTDQNATKNYNLTGETTGYWITVSNDSNSKVDFCLKASGDMVSSGGDRIGLGNETYTNSVISNSTSPNVVDQASMTDSYAKTASAVDEGTSNYYRFWLDIPAAQASGTYTNNVNFKGVTQGNNCGE